MLVEVCANSLDSAKAAQAAGADRIELCTELSVGGLTPSYGLLEEVLRAVQIPVRVLIRPRAGHFTYSPSEFKVMLRDIAYCEGLGVDGIVSGCLFADGNPDLERTGELMAAAPSKKFTFHRAFDWVPDPAKVFEQLQALGVDCVLTSGQVATAEKGLPLLRELLKLQTVTELMPGSGINPVNAERFKQIGFTAIHFSGTQFQEGDITEGIPMHSPAMIENTGYLRTSEALVRQVVARVKG